jgi:hypothetical protein
MRRATWNYVVDMILLLLTAVEALSVVMLWLVLPQGFFPSRLLWLDIHKWVGLALTVAVIVHLILHWRWLWTTTRRRFGAGRRAADRP